MYIYIYAYILGVYILNVYKYNVYKYNKNTHEKYVYDRIMILRLISRQVRSRTRNTYHQFSNIQSGKCIKNVYKLFLILFIYASISGIFCIPHYGRTMNTR